MIRSSQVQVCYQLYQQRVLQIYSDQMSNKECYIETQTVEASKINPESPTHSISKPQATTIIKQSSIYSRLHESDQLWRESSLSLTRDKSPSHKIPQSIRFKPSSQERHNRQFLTLQLRENMRLDKNINFSKSQRPQHWVKGLGQFGPSPASYKFSRFLDESHYKSIEMKQAYDMNPFSTLYFERKMKTTLKGQSFTKFENHHKSYVQHAKHMFYQPQNVEGQPGPGQYTSTWANKPKSRSYSIRPTLQRFNEGKNLNPGPGTYMKKNPAQLKPLSRKGAFSRGQRDHRWKLNDFPSPDQYAIHRFLQQYK